MYNGQGAVAVVNRMEGDREEQIPTSPFLGHCVTIRIIIDDVPV